MPADRERTEQNLSMSWGGNGMEPDAEEGGDLAWWFTGGFSLLVWTGLAVLLTSA